MPIIWFYYLVKFDMSIQAFVFGSFLFSAQAPLAGAQQPQPNPLLPFIQACVDAITEHQRLNTLMKGELIKGLLPQSSVRADYTVQRVRGRLISSCHYLKQTRFGILLYACSQFVCISRNVHRNINHESMIMHAY